MNLFQSKEMHDRQYGIKKFLSVYKTGKYKLIIREYLILDYCLYIIINQQKKINKYEKKC